MTEKRQKKDNIEKVRFFISFTFTHLVPTQLTFTSSKSTIETLEKCVKYV